MELLLTHVGNILSKLWVFLLLDQFKRWPWWNIKNFHPNVRLNKCSDKICHSGRILWGEFLVLLSFFFWVIFLEDRFPFLLYKVIWATNWVELQIEQTWDRPDPRTRAGSVAAGLQLDRGSFSWALVLELDGNPLVSFLCRLDLRCHIIWIPHQGKVFAIFLRTNNLKSASNNLDNALVKLH